MLTIVIYEKTNSYLAMHMHPNRWEILDEFTNAKNSFDQLLLFYSLRDTVHPKSKVSCDFLAAIYFMIKYII
jgi:hypothetical protein